MTLIPGYKTYVCAIGIALTGIAHAFGVIDDATYTTLLTVCGAGGLAALRAGLNKGGT